MEKTIRFALFLFLVTGLLFTACAKEGPAEGDYVSGSLEESLEIGDEEEEEGDVEDGVEDESSEEDVNTNSSSSSTTQESGAQNTEAAAYSDGTYTQSGSYVTPAGQETIGVTLVVEGGLITSVSINNTAKDDTSQAFVKLFSEGISSVVLGKPIDSINNVGAVNGSSLTPNGFNAAVELILAEAGA